MEEVLIPKETRVPAKTASTGSELAALNDLMGLLNNNALTGAVVPPEAKEAVKVPRQKGRPGTGLIETPDAAPPLPAPAQAAVDVVTKVPSRPLIVLTGLSGAGKSWLQTRLTGQRNVITNIVDAADFRALKAAGAEFWHVMCAANTRTRRSSPTAVARAPGALVSALEVDAVKKLKERSTFSKLKVIWNDTNEVAPYGGMYNASEFIHAVS